MSLASALVRRRSARTVVRHVAAAVNVRPRGEYGKVQRRPYGVSVRENRVNVREIPERIRSAA
jgi:transcriptional regulator GlxA family with amidase domain